jgi:hypothetical protein
MRVMAFLRQDFGAAEAPVQFVLQLQRKTKAVPR